MTAIGVTTAKRLDFGEVVKLTFGVLRRNVRQFALAGLILAAVPTGLLTFAQGELAEAKGPAASPFDLMTLGLGLFGYLATMIGSALLQVAVVQATVADLNGKKAALADGLSLGLRLFLPLFGVSFFATMGAILGMVVFIAPGLLLMVMWSVAVPVLVVEKRGVFESLKRSSDLTQNSRWTILGLLLVYLIVYFLIAIALEAVMGAVGSGSVLAPTGLASAVAAALVAGVGSVVSAIGVAVIYYMLRSAKEGVGPDQLAAVFD